MLELLKPWLREQIRDDMLSAKSNELVVLANDVLSAEVEVKLPMERYVLLLPGHRQQGPGAESGVGGHIRRWQGLRHDPVQLRIKIKLKVTKEEQEEQASAAAASVAAAAVAVAPAGRGGAAAKVDATLIDIHDDGRLQQDSADLAKAAAPAVAAVMRASTLDARGTSDIASVPGKAAAAAVASESIRSGAQKRPAGTAPPPSSNTNKRARTIVPPPTRRHRSNNNGPPPPLSLLSNATAVVNAAEIEVITIDDDDDEDDDDSEKDPQEVVEQVADMSRISTVQLKVLVKAVEPELWQIFKGKRQSARHDQYRKKGKARAALKHQVKFGEMTEQQQEFILATLTEVFCKKGEKYMRYVMDVLFPECLIRMVIMSMSSINTHDEAEAYLASGGANAANRM